MIQFYQILQLYWLQHCTCNLLEEILACEASFICYPTGRSVLVKPASFVLLQWSRLHFFFHRKAVLVKPASFFFHSKAVLMKPTSFFLPQESCASEVGINFSSTGRPGQWRQDASIQFPFPLLHPKMFNPTFAHTKKNVKIDQKCEKNAKNI